MHDHTTMTTREAWLMAMTTYFKTDFEAQDYPLPEVRVTCGWPSQGALAPTKRIIGECWSASASADRTVEIFVSPILANPIEVGAVLVHELVHAAAGIEWGHKGPFRRLAIRLGLHGPMRSTTASIPLKERLNALTQQLGPYPHATLDVTHRRKQDTRLLKCVCPSCGYTARITRRWIAYGLPVCPCGTHFVPGWHGAKH